MDFEKILANFFAVLVFAFVVFVIGSCFHSLYKTEQEYTEQVRKDATNNNRSGYKYELVFSDGGKDTINVWGDEIYMDYEQYDILNRPVNLVLYYVPFRKYNMNEALNIKNYRQSVYNVLRFNKIKQ